MSATRYLLVTADDYGIGPLTSRAIRELGSLGVVTSTVLLVNSPYAEREVDLWRRDGKPVEMGWHPNLTLDRPILPPTSVSSLINAEGRFHSLAGLMLRLFAGRIRGDEVRAELAAQMSRFVELVGHWPANVNGHKHIHVFPFIGAVIRDLLGELPVPPYLRRLREPWSIVTRVRGARTKRIFLSCWGKRAAGFQMVRGLIGNDWLAGVTDPPWVKDPAFLVRWLRLIPGEIVELMVHPGYRDESLLGRDCTPGQGRPLQRRVDERYLLQHPNFRNACQLAGFKLITAAELIQRRRRNTGHAA